MKKVFGPVVVLYVDGILVVKMRRHIGKTYLSFFIVDIYLSFYVLLIYFFASLNIEG